MSESTPTIAAVLLGAGRSARFGTDKLAAGLGGGTVIGRSALSLRAATSGPRLAVLRRPEQSLLLPDGFQIALCEGQQSDSLRMAADWAARTGADGLLIALADMPFVPPDLHRAVISRLAALPACASNGHTAMPPAIFPASWFPRLRALGGDRGAGALLGNLPASQQIAAAPEQLRDIDTPADLP
ncbi:nucleotidyltransferase family protein [Paracoccus aurantiacus]|uniref:nucleotidyltransferase family protein n=1 Tax=Paracoccus aurantiacus TaxID=2599412 RepID=UPI00164CA7AB|nr:nucleotidyltransferase family protein [Paracoccus aurantiacus]